MHTADPLHSGPYGQIKVNLISAVDVPELPRIEQSQSSKFRRAAYTRVCSTPVRWGNQPECILRGRTAGPNLGVPNNETSLLMALTYHSRHTGIERKKKCIKPPNGGERSSVKPCTAVLCITAVHVTK